MSIPLTSLFALLLTHFIADFILQSDAMAKGKSKSIKMLTYHVIVYSLVLFAVFASFPINNAIIFAFVNGLLHWITDFFTSRINSYLWNKGDVHNFFVGIGADQLIHYICLVGTYQLIYNS